MEFGFFGPTEKHNHARGGFCISAFALMVSEGRLLLVRPSDEKKWMEEWMPNWRVYGPEELRADFQKWRLPSAYVMEGEHPSVTLGRIMRQQLGIQEFRVLGWSLESFYGPSRRYPGEMHWDYCFVFRVAGEPKPRSPWVADSRYASPGEVQGEMGSAQGDLVQRLFHEGNGYT